MKSCWSRSSNRGASALKTLSIVFLLTLSIIPGPGLSPASAQQCPTLVWADEFAGTSLDLTRWSYQIGDGCAEGICGWGNNELQSYQQGNVTVGSGTLKITARQERIRGKQYTSGRIRTINQGDFFFGRFEARIKLTTGQGIWPAFWMLSTDEVFGPWPASGEIDIMENIGSEPATVHATMHYGADFQNRRQAGNNFKLNQGAFADGFHEFAVEKEPGILRWFVDDVLYLTQTEAGIAPENWPFDERFYILLNVAVGGNFPGSPDATTVFPQVLEVDYVRVYDGNFPHVTGDRVVPNQASGIVYSVGNAPAGSSFSWSVPAGAAIVSGQGTNSITVDWGSTSGPVVVDVNSGCGAEQLSIDVEVEPPFAFDFTFENFESPGAATFLSSTGTLVEGPNPAPSGVNTSATSGEYTRNSAEQFDVIFYGTSAISNAAQYADKQKKFAMDVYTGAPVGTQILIQLEDSSSATPSNYPTGRHSRYEAFTGVQNQWERLLFAPLDQPDPSTSDTGVDNIIVLFATNSFTGDVFTFDNFDSWIVDGGGGDPTAVHVFSIVPGTQNAGKGKKRGTATVTVVDDLGNPVAGAQVTGTFSGSFNETVSGTTGAAGTVTVTTTATLGGTVSFTFCVDNVVHSTLPYDPAANAETCDSL